MFRDTDHNGVTNKANEWIDTQSIEVLEIKFEYPFVIVIYYKV